MIFPRAYGRHQRHRGEPTAAGRSGPRPDYDSRRSSHPGWRTVQGLSLCHVMGVAVERLAQKEEGPSNSVRSTTES
jgi:hypothetical protein